MGNYFRPRARLWLWLCLVGPISVQKAHFKLKNCTSWAVCCSWTLCCPFLSYLDKFSLAYESIFFYLLLFDQRRTSILFAGLVIAILIICRLNMRLKVLQDWPLFKTCKLILFQWSRRSIMMAYFNVHCPSKLYYLNNLLFCFLN